MVVSLGQRMIGAVKHLGEAVVPMALFAPGLPQRATTTVRINTVPLSQLDREKIKRSRGPIYVSLDPALALLRRIDLPTAAASKSETAIGLQLRQTLPAQGQGLVWRSMAIRRERDTTEYAVYILKQSALDSLLVDLRNLGVRVERVSLDVTGLAPFWERRPISIQVTKNWLAFSVLTTVLAAVASIVGLAADRSALLDLTSTRAEQVAELEKRRDALKASEGESEKSAAAALNDIATFVEQSRRLQLLTDLTDVLPDTVWVSELSFSGDRLVFSGFTSSEVTTVINQLRKLPWAREVQLNGAISFDSYSGENRFEIGLVVAPGERT